MAHWAAPVLALMHSPSSDTSTLRIRALSSSSLPWGLFLASLAAMRQSLRSFSKAESRGWWLIVMGLTARKEPRLPVQTRK